MSRPTIDEYACALAAVAASRSEDPDRKVGAVALDHENRVVALAYNGLAAGMELTPDLMADRDARRPYMIHAEQNLCALFKRGDVRLVAITHAPCSACASLLAAHGVERVIFLNQYSTDQFGPAVLEAHGITFKHHAS